MFSCSLESFLLPTVSNNRYLSIFFIDLIWLIYQGDLLFSYSLVIRYGAVRRAARHKANSSLSPRRVSDGVIVFNEIRIILHYFISVDVGRTNYFPLSVYRMECCSVVGFGTVSNYWNPIRKCVRYFNALIICMKLRIMRRLKTGQAECWSDGHSLFHVFLGTIVPEAVAATHYWNFNCDFF